MVNFSGSFLDVEFILERWLLPHCVAYPRIGCGQRPAFAASHLPTRQSDDVETFDRCG
jgi:hypothetical protein